MSAATASTSARARRASNSKGMDALARLGLAARGAIYLLIGVLAVLLAFGEKKGETDQRGAMQQLAQHTGGFVVLLIIAVGLAGYALWRFSEAAFGVAGEGKRPARAQSAIRGVVYTLLAVSASRSSSRAGTRARPSSSSRTRPGSCVTAPVVGWSG